MSWCPYFKGEFNTHLNCIETQKSVRGVPTYFRESSFWGSTAHLYYREFVLSSEFKKVCFGLAFCTKLVNLFGALATVHGGVVVRASD